MHIPVAYGQWSVFDHNGDNQLAVLGTRYGIWWPWYGQFEVGWLQPLQLWSGAGTSLVAPMLVSQDRGLCHVQLHPTWFEPTLVILSKEPLHYREFQFSCWWLLEQGSITWILEEWKNALFKPLRKKLGLESFFRPVSNSPFIYKHLKVTPLAMLDLSEAFDQTDHSILLETLVSGFGVSGTGLKWFTSYLSQRTQQVQIQLTLSEKKQLITGVPQGSCIVLCCAQSMFRPVPYHRKAPPSSLRLGRWPPSLHVFQTHNLHESNWLSHCHLELRSKTEELDDFKHAYCEWQ